MIRDERARVQVSDAVVGSLVAITVLGTAPAYYGVIDKIAAEAGPLGTLLLDLVVPFLLIGVVVSVGVSARREENA